jgi:hypothetical protein
MTKALQDAFKEAATLPEAEQDQLAALADEALAEHRSGRSLPLDPDTL